MSYLFLVSNKKRQYSRLFIKSIESVIYYHDICNNNMNRKMKIEEMEKEEVIVKVEKIMERHSKVYDRLAEI